MINRETPAMPGFLCATEETQTLTATASLSNKNLNIKGYGPVLFDFNFYDQYIIKEDW